MGKIILMKFTSRGRYETLKKCVEAYREKANNIKDMWWLFTIDNDDIVPNSNHHCYVLFSFCSSINCILSMYQCLN